MKNAAVAGLIAGFFGGCGATIAYIIGVGTRLIPFPLETLNTTYLLNHLFFEVMIHVIYGSILAVIYSKLYDWIPSKGILKALIYSFLIYFIANVRTSLLIVGHSADAIATPFPIGFLFAGFFVFLFYGIVLGFLYKKGD
jgi:hypothetical protein